MDIDVFVFLVSSTAQLKPQYPICPHYWDQVRVAAEQISMTTSCDRDLTLDCGDNVAIRAGRFLAIFRSITVPPVTAAVSWTSVPFKAWFSSKLGYSVGFFTPLC